MNEFRHSSSIPANIKEVFEFFSKAENLERITPAFLKFRILTPLPIQMEEGVKIDYRLQIHHLPMKWRTLISEWNPPYAFTDTQLSGPYQTWIHRHTFEPAEDSETTLMTDHVQYRLFTGPLLHSWIRRDIERIFHYRNQAIRDIFTISAIKKTLIPSF
ncbi:MAG: SRPBCC family protein [Opitutales bacterium]|nr:SRPBCC family protein [Opitutales bacterium]